ncbi:bifunctional proline dehydrogenase/L-glutamate gamma-semialdehyde dehydrogenase [Adhaeretor mobilis]|uniref:L-glutamate gamma-semialdehyde dehydrogenase n=1 Tax=Adhaeretor mobilis TaxID=1930276 RepID=A0A517MPP2_9BACT|nr:bifunctional proline dehydrogenase/L-glutamate gamma-semialdehyde dehydrogenase [Adhaeretor mobilis]QDS96853.1 Bifunctional protein PutA [Adhaeretor mobilis]
MPEQQATDALQHVHSRVRDLLSDAAIAESAPNRRVKQAVFLARELQRRASELQTPAEKHQQHELDEMIQSPADKQTLMQMTDQAFRSHSSSRSANQLVNILDVQGIPRFFGVFDKAMLKGFQNFGSYLPGVAMPLVKEKMQHETANVVLPAEEQLLKKHLIERHKEGLRMNVNVLGEALLGEKEAQRRLQSYLRALSRPEVEVISVKISTIYSQISPIARERTISVICDRMELLYRAAVRHKFTLPDGSESTKFVYLDMEEYRDKQITAEVFMRTLDRPGVENVRAGIALQAYLPDSFATQKCITEWARQRVAAGKSPVTIRLVKGANMEMERVEASLFGWPVAPFTNKIETDANYLKMLQYGFQPENIAAVRIGVASHNLFSLAYGLVLAFEAEALDLVQFEMLEGMANHQRRAMFELSKNMLLYAPACTQEDFVHAIGYLVRRLDENTGEENFLRHAFSLKVGDDEWEMLEEGFLQAFRQIDSVSEEPNRTQDRNDTEAEPALIRSLRGSDTFNNVPDTDWSLPQNGEWAQGIAERWLSRHSDGPEHHRAADVPLVVAGKEIFDDRKVNDTVDPSRPDKVVARYREGTNEDITDAVACAVDDPTGWRQLPVAQRREILERVAEEIARRRGDLMGAMLAEGGKTLAESDPEVSEAIDFCRYYGQSAMDFHKLEGLTPSGKGVVAVVSPWNFPLAIPCGGVAAALAAGNTTIIKPASDTAMIAYRVCECFWEAGVPKEALQFLTGRGGTVGHQLVTHETIDAVILTGGTSTAEKMLAAKPAMNLLAETGGKNATIVTALADRDLAIKNVLHSAFSHGGQKCSATSLLLLEEEVYNDQKFRDMLCDAVESLRVGSAWNLSTKIGPLIRPPSGDLEQGLKDLEDDETWAVMPRLHVDDNPNLVAPGVKWGVTPGSYTHNTELFGPVLGVMCVKDLEHAIELVNATGYGLTSGLESLDHREHEIWKRGLLAGNLYVNRSTTGAIVLRQPFGGMGKSAVGPGVKAGGPNYVATLMNFATKAEGGEGTKNSPAENSRELTAHRSPDTESITTEPTQPQWEAYQQLCTAINDPTLTATLASYEQWAEEEFLSTHDHFQLLGEDNIRRYLPVEQLRIRVHSEDTPWQVYARVAGARAAGCETTVSVPSDLTGEAMSAVSRLKEIVSAWSPQVEFLVESDKELAQRTAQREVGRLRYADPTRVPAAVRKAAADALLYVADTPVSEHGRIELLWYFREQSISHVYHRYGNLGLRSGELKS